MNPLAQMNEAMAYLEERLTDDIEFARMAQIAGLGSAAAGCAVTVVYIRLRAAKTKAQTPPPQQDAAPAPMRFLTACFPYLTLIALSVLSQLPPVKSALSGFAWGLDYPAVQTAPRASYVG